MKVQKTKLKDVLLIKPNVFHDNRGYFFESFNAKFCKQLIKVNKYIPNFIGLVELGGPKFPKNIELRMVTFWARIVTGSLSHVVYRLLRIQYEKAIYCSKCILKGQYCVCFRANLHIFKTMSYKYSMIGN